MGIRKKLTTTRHLFRTMKWVCYHAHPVNIVGHPFKGSYVMSTGYLAHPDMKRFALDDATLYVPPRPDAWAQSLVNPSPAAAIPSFGDFFGTYFAGKNFSVANPKCSSMLESMKKCWENHTDADPTEACSFYISGFERLACAK